MTHTPPRPPPADPVRSAPAQGASPALGAFLRGVERRGAVLAELQAGDARVGDGALGAAMRGFARDAQDMPMADWPVRFWQRLLSEPGLARRTPVAIELDAADGLAELGSGPRAALLLRLAAGLSEADAARTLGVALPSYRLALQRALPRHRDGRADPQAWSRLREAVHRRIKTLDPERLARLGRLREAALAGGPMPAFAPAASDDGVRQRAPWPRWVWALPAACVLAWAATYWTPVETWLTSRLNPLDAGEIRTGALPEEAPRARFGETAGLLAHRDYDLLADPDGLAAAQDVAFLSWLAAQDAADAPVELAPMPDAATAALEPAAPSPDPLATETLDAPR